MGWLSDAWEDVVDFVTEPGEELGDWVEETFMPEGLKATITDIPIVGDQMSRGWLGPFFQQLTDEGKEAEVSSSTSDLTEQLYTIAVLAALGMTGAGAMGGGAGAGGAGAGGLGGAGAGGAGAGGGTLAFGGGTAAGGSSALWAPTLAAGAGQGAATSWIPAALASAGAGAATVGPTIASGAGGTMNFADMLSRVAGQNPSTGGFDWATLTGQGPAQGSMPLDLFAGGASSSGNLLNLITQLGTEGGGTNWLNTAKQAYDLYNQIKGGGQQQTGQQKDTTGTNWLQEFLKSLGLGGTTGSGVAGGGAEMLPLIEMQTPQPAQYLTGPDILNQSLTFGKEQFPLAYGAKELGLSRIGEMSPTNTYWEQFGPTSFEQALGSQYFQNVMPEITKSILHQQSLAGMAESPITAQLIADQARKAGVDVGTYLANLGQRRGELALQGTQQGIQQQIGQDPYATMAPYTNLLTSQSNLQQGENYQNALQLAKNQYLYNIAKEQEKSAKIGSLTSLGGGTLGAILGSMGLGGLNTGTGGQLGSILGNILSPLWGGNAGTNLQDIFSTIGGYRPTTTTPASNTGTVQLVNPSSQFGDFSNIWGSGQNPMGGAMAVDANGNPLNNNFGFAY